MKLLHISDLHLGRLLYGRSLIEDQRHFIFETLLPALDSLRPDVLLVAGDLFDRPVAPPEAIRLFDSLLEALSARQIPSVLISGNHDSPDRIAVGAKMLAAFGLHIATTLEDAFSPIIVGDAQIFALPYVENAEIRAFFGDDTLRGTGACMAAMIARMQQLFAPDKRHVLVAHCFAAGSTVSDSESGLFVGGSGEVPVDCFDAFDYVALGHLHAAQRAGEKARYSGSPLKYSVDEAHQKKSMTLVTLEETARAELLPVVPLRDVKRLSGTFDALLRNGEAQPDSDFVEIVLTDEAPVYMPAERLRAVYPNLLSVRNEWFLRMQQNAVRPAARQSDAGAIFSGFLSDICGEEPQPGDTALFSEIMRELEGAR